MQLSLSNPEPVVAAGPVIWREVEKGFEVAELPVVVHGHEVDTILLNGIDPAYYRFVARNAPAGDLGIDEWEKAVPQAVPIVNDSYCDHKGKPDTPILSEGVPMGPTDYDAKAGAFVAGDGFADIKDLSAQSVANGFSRGDQRNGVLPLLFRCRWSDACAGQKAACQPDFCRQGQQWARDRRHDKGRLSSRSPGSPIS
jgi:hypothetical protein